MGKLYCYLVGPIFASSLLSLGFEVLDELLLVPTNFSGEILEDGEVSQVVESNASEGRGDGGSLHVAVWIWDTLENLKSGECSSSSWGFMWQHTSDGSPEDLGWVFVMPWTTSPWVSVADAVNKLSVGSEVSLEWTSDVEFFSSNNDDLLSVQQFLGDNGGESSQKVSLGVNNDYFLKHLICFYIGSAAPIKVKDF